MNELPTPAQLEHWASESQNEGLDPGVRAIAAQLLLMAAKKMREMLAVRRA